MDNKVKYYTPQDEVPAAINLVPYQNAITACQAQSQSYKMRWQAIEEVISQLQGKNWVEADGFAWITE